MNREETVKVLTMVSALDGRTADEMQVEMWLEMFRNFSFDQVKAAIIPAYKESDKGFLTAKGVWDVLRREAAIPGPKQWIRDLHNIGEHFACEHYDCLQWSEEDKVRGVSR
jgi:hypothetical protein